MTTWTQRDENLYQELDVRRDKVLTARLAAIATVVGRFNTNTPAIHSALIDDLIHHADAIRDALKPYDSGVRCKSKGGVE